MWAPRGERPIASARRVYQWAYLFSFVRPATGETVHFIGSTVSAAAMSAVLDEWAKEAGLGPQRRAVLVLDGAGWHSAKDLRIPEGVHLAFLPPYSPELQPAERLWPSINEGVANRDCADLDELKQRVGGRCMHLDANREHVHRLTNYHWWPKEVRSAR